jgi:hypothetical protein
MASSTQQSTIDKLEGVPGEGQAPAFPRCRRRSPSNPPSSFHEAAGKAKKAVELEKNSPSLSSHSHTSTLSQRFAKRRGLYYESSAPPPILLGKFY